MDAPLAQDNLPAPALTLAFGEVSLQFVKVLPGDPSRGFVPSYHFRIVTRDGSEVGHVNLRIGDTQHVLLCAGHIGFQIKEKSRGHGYAFQACRALAPFIRSFYLEVIITCDPDNIASRRTIERLGASFLEEIAVPPEDAHFQRGSSTKRRYRWTPA